MKQFLLTPIFSVFFSLTAYFDKLTIQSLFEELALLPFSAKVVDLHCVVDINYILQPNDFDSLAIVPKGLTIRMPFDAPDEDWDELLISFWN